MGASLRDRAATPSEPSQSSVVSGVAGIPSAWRTDSPPFGKRPIWQYVWVQGECYHSGTTWFRQGWGTAAIRINDAEDSFQGFRRSDIERICRDNDMAIESADVVGWLPAIAPAPLREKQLPRLKPNDDGEYAASAIEARRAATGNTDAVHESAAASAETPNGEQP